MGVNLTLDKISNFIKQTKISENTYVYIVEKDGKLVADTLDEKLYVEDSNKKPLRIKANEVKSNIIAKSYKSIINSNSKSTVEKIDNQTYIIAMKNYSDNYGLNWDIITVTNELDFMGNIYKNLKETIYLGIVLIILILIVSFVIAKRIQKPINELNIKAKEISDGKYGETIDNNQKTIEFVQLVNTFNKMSHELKLSFDNLNNMNLTLEKNVQIRTAQLEEANAQISKSIDFAAIIQETFNYKDESVSHFFDDYFIVLKQRDKVGGDIVLFEKLNDDECLLMDIDCTSHGVPGAFVTMIVKTLQKQILNEKETKSLEYSPAHILKRFNYEIKHLLEQTQEESKSNVGFDGQIIYYNKKKNILKFASARNDIIILDDEKLNRYKGNKHSVGYKDSNENFEFTEHTIYIEKYITVYIFSDGFTDQLGGQRALPFGNKKTLNILQNSKYNSLNKQKEYLLSTLEEYSKGFEQNDDISFVGLKIVKSEKDSN